MEEHGYRLERKLYEVPEVFYLSILVVVTQMHPYLKIIELKLDAHYLLYYSHITL